MLKEIEVRSTRKEQLIDITREIEKAVSESRVKDGVCITYCPHTTAAITVNENADKDVEEDIIKKLKELSKHEGYTHAEGNSDAHVVSSIIGCSQVTIIKDHKLLLGTWQGIRFLEFDGPRQRKVQVKIISG